jgi:hypothetical protein
MSGADFLGHQAHQAAGQDRDEGDLDESDEVFFRPFEDGVQPAVAADPGQGALNPNTLRNEGPAAGAGLDGDAEPLLDSRSPR